MDTDEEEHKEKTKTPSTGIWTPASGSSNLIGKSNDHSLHFDNLDSSEFFIGHNLPVVSRFRQITEAVREKAAKIRTEKRKG